MSASGKEGDGRARRRARDQLLAALEFLLRGSACILLREGVAIAADLHEQALRECVDDGGADTVQTTGDLVTAAVSELATGVQDSQHDLDRGTALLLHDRNGDTATVVDLGDRVVGMDRDGHLCAEAGKGLVHRVVHKLVHKMVKTHDTSRADVHTGTLANRLQTLEDRNVLRVVAGVASHSGVVSAALYGSLVLRA